MRPIATHIAILAVPIIVFANQHTPTQTAFSRGWLCISTVCTISAWIESVFLKSRFRVSWISTAVFGPRIQESDENNPLGFLDRPLHTWNKMRFNRCFIALLPVFKKIIPFLRIFALNLSRFFLDFVLMIFFGCRKCSFVWTGLPESCFGFVWLTLEWRPAFAAIFGSACLLMHNRIS